jgi:radical SAM protein with 4Fe4S-binding SPASM domain
MVDRIVDQLAALGVETVNLGGNEPIFTSGLDVSKSLLPYVIQALSEAGMHVGLTTSGITLVQLERLEPAAVRSLNDVDVSLDSPYPEEHNQSRGADLFDQAIEAINICRRSNVHCTIVMCAMSWNFTAGRLDRMVELARNNGACLRVNVMKPVRPSHLPLVPSLAAFYQGFSRLMASCEQVDLGEPVLAAVTGHRGQGCPCGRSSFRIHSITPEGAIPVSPCVYLHDYTVGDILKDDLRDIIAYPQFASFRRRAAHPEVIPGCEGCPYLSVCRGGCAARSYLHHLFETGRASLFVRDPYCLRAAQEVLGEDFPAFPQCPLVAEDRTLVHRDYLCTWIGQPRTET